MPSGCVRSSVTRWVGTRGLAAEAAWAAPGPPRRGEAARERARERTPLCSRHRIEGVNGQAQLQRGEERGRALQAAERALVGTVGRGRGPTEAGAQGPRGGP